MNQLPPLSEDERGRLRASIMQDGIIVPVLHDAQGDVIDGHHRKAIAMELGIDYPAQTLDVDDDTADRLRLTLNWARRQLDTLAAYELIAELAKRHDARAKADAQQRMVKAGAVGGRGKGKEPGSLPFAGQSREAIADMINDDLEAAGESRRIGGRTVDMARRAAALSEATKQQIRAGKLTPTEALRPSRAKKNRQTANSGSGHARSVPEHVAAQARIRAMDAELKYRSMLNAPEGKLNIPLLDRASKVQDLLLELTGITPEKAVSGIPAMRCREYSPEMARWWLRFVELCDERRRMETPELPTLYKRPRLPSLNPVVLGTTVAPTLMSPTMQAVYDWVAEQSEPVTVVEAAVATRINRSTVGDALRKLVQTGRIEMIGKVGSGANDFNLYQITVTVESERRA